jgi:hypothetical protein
MVFSHMYLGMPFVPSCGSAHLFFCKILILFLVHMVISVAHLESCFLPVLTLKVCHSDILILMAFVSLIL